MGVTKDYVHVGLGANDHLDTTTIRNAIGKYIDGDFIVVAAEHVVDGEEEESPKRYGIVYVSRRSAQPVLAANDGQVPGGRPPHFRSGDILIRRGAASEGQLR